MRICDKCEMIITNERTPNCSNCKNVLPLNMFDQIVRILPRVQNLFIFIHSMITFWAKIFSRHIFCFISPSLDFKRCNVHLNITFLTNFSHKFSTSIRNLSILSILKNFHNQQFSYPHKACFLYSNIYKNKKQLFRFLGL